MGKKSKKKKSKAEEEKSSVVGEPLPEKKKGKKKGEKKSTKKAANKKSDKKTSKKDKKPSKKDKKKSGEQVHPSSKHKSSKKGGRRGRMGGKKKKYEYIDENIYSMADDELLERIEAKETKAVRDIVSEELYNPAGSDVVEYGDAKVWDFSDATKVFSLETVKTMEIDPDKNVKVLDIEKTVKVIDIDGHEIKEEDKPKTGRRSRHRGKKGKKEHDKRPRRKIIDESKLTFDPLEQIQEYKKNWDQYKLKCKTCQNSRRCQVCEGTGRKFFIFKCKTCGGDGKCPDCKKTYGVKCQNCKEKVINYSPRCLECGHEHRCPKCFAPLPVTATKCLKCRTEFICRRCKLPIAPGFEKRCPRCNAKIKQALY